MAMNNLTSLISRLEAATSRLEDIATSSAAGTTNGDQPGETPDKMRLFASNPSAGLPQPVSELDDLMSEKLDHLVDASRPIDPSVASQVDLLARAFDTQREHVLLSFKSKKPAQDSSAYQKLLQRLGSEMNAVEELKDRHPGSPYKDHLNMLANSCQLFNWLTLTRGTADWIGEQRDAAQFYGNRVMKEYREKDEQHVAYVRSYYALLTALQQYVKQHFPTGIEWNSEGVDLSEAMDDLESPSPKTQASSSRPATSQGVPPPPPPPPPPALLPATANGAAKPAGGDMGAVFSQLNMGSSVTSGLRKVAKSEMTHKNPALRQGATVSTSIAKPASSTTTLQSQAPVPQKTPKKELDGNKWIIEYHNDLQGPIELDVSLSQSVLISRCNNTTIKLNGKANAVSIDNCKRTNLIIDQLVSSVDVVKSPNFALQVLQSLPTIMLDQVDGASIYLSKESLATEIYTSKCSGVNVNVPPAREDDDYRELPVPEQFRSFVKDGTLISEIVEHAG